MQTKTNQRNTVLAGITNQMELTKYLKNISWTQKEYIAFSTVHRTFSKIDQTFQQHKTNLNRQTKIEVRLSFFFDHQELKVNIINTRNNRKLI